MRCNPPASTQVRPGRHSTKRRQLFEKRSRPRTALRLKPSRWRTGDSALFRRTGGSDSPAPTKPGTPRKSGKSQRRFIVRYDVVRVVTTTAAKSAQGSRLRAHAGSRLLVLGHPKPRALSPKPKRET